MLEEKPISPLTEPYYITQDVHGNPPAIDASTGKCGSDIVSVLSGRVRFANLDPNHRSGLGLFIIVEHSDNRESLYSHFSKIVVQWGQEVEQGELLGYLGNTGKSSGCHIHYSNNWKPNALLIGDPPYRLLH